jgi:hypothetical protein
MNKLTKCYPIYSATDQRSWIIFKLDNLKRDDRGINSEFWVCAQSLFRGDNRSVLPATGRESKANRHNRSIKLPNRATESRHGDSPTNVSK